MIFATLVLVLIEIVVIGVLVAGVLFSLCRRRDDDQPATLEGGSSHMRDPR